MHRRELFHGSNDGQKGMGLVVLILVGILPAQYALNPATTAGDLQRIEQHSIASAGCLGKLTATEIRGKQAADGLSDFLKAKGVSTGETMAALAGLNQTSRTLCVVVRATRSSARSEARVPQQNLPGERSHRQAHQNEKDYRSATASRFAAYAKQLDKETKYIPNG